MSFVESMERKFNKGLKIFQIAVIYLGPVQRFVWVHGHNHLPDVRVDASLVESKERKFNDSFNRSTF